MSTNAQSMVCTPCLSVGVVFLDIPDVSKHNATSFQAEGCSPSSLQLMDLRRETPMRGVIHENEDGPHGPVRYPNGYAAVSFQF